MKKIFVLLLLAFSGIMCAESACAMSKKVAVYVEGTINSNNKSIISSAVLSKMSGNNNFMPFERNDAFLSALNKEQDFQLSGDVPESEIREVGGRFGVDYILAINVIMGSDDVCYMTAKLINVVSGGILDTVTLNRKCEGTSTLVALANNVAYRILNKNKGL